MWDYLARQMGRLWHAQRHEDRYSPDIPDLSYGFGGTEGWIELKTIPGWPANPNKPVSIPHLRAGQVNWIEERNKYGSSHTWLLLAVGASGFDDADWVLIRGSDIRRVYDKQFTQMDILLRHRHGKGRELRDFLCLDLY